MCSSLVSKANLSHWSILTFARKREQLTLFWFAASNVLSIARIRTAGFTLCYCRHLLPFKEGKFGAFRAFDGSIATTRLDIRSNPIFPATESFLFHCKKWQNKNLFWIPGVGFDPALVQVHALAVRSHSAFSHFVSANPLDFDWLTLLPSSLQVQQAATGPPKYKGPVDVAKSLFREGGIRSVYKGSVATLLRGKTDLPACLPTYRKSMLWSSCLKSNVIATTNNYEKALIYMYSMYYRYW